MAYKEFVEYWKHHPGSMSSKARMVWWSNGKKDKEGYNLKVYSKGKKRKQSGRNLNVKGKEPKKKKENTSGGGNSVVHNYYY